DLLGAVWVGNPKDPRIHTMTGYPGSCYRATYGETCPGFMYGSMAPGNTWQLTFLHANLANPPRNFVPVPPTDPLFSMGNGIVSPNPPKPPHGGGGGGGGGHHHGPPTRGGGGGGGCGGGGGPRAGPSARPPRARATGR